MAVSFDDDLYIKWCIFGWISVGLISKNIVFLGLLISLRIKNKQFNFPEDKTIFRQQRRVANQPVLDKTRKSITNEDLSITQRITKVLGNETEYVTYFLILFLAYTIAPKVATTRQIIYGTIFVMSRYLHNFGLIFRSSYLRLIGFIVSILVLAAITLDLAIILTLEVARNNSQDIDLSF